MYGIIMLKSVIRCQVAIHDVRTPFLCTQSFPIIVYIIQRPCSRAGFFIASAL